MISKFFKKKIGFIVFCIVGGVSAIVDVTSLYFASKIMNFNDNISVTVAFFFGLLVNYYLHTYLTFKSKPTKNNLLKFMAVVCINYLFTILLIKMMLSFFLLDLIVAKIVTLPIIAIIGYLTSKYWVYHE